MKDVHELAEAIKQAAEAEDLQSLEKLGKFFKEVGSSSQIEFDVEKFTRTAIANETERATALASDVSWKKRSIVYTRRRLSGYNGPIIISAGDSWFNYPLLLDDVIDWLSREYAVSSLRGTSSIVDILNENEYASAVEAEGGDIFLLSGGWDDMLSNGKMTRYLNWYAPSMNAADVLNTIALRESLSLISDTYDKIFANLIRQFPNLHILCHGYDYPIPRVDGVWLGKALAARNVPSNLWSEILHLFIDELYNVLQAVVAKYPGRVHLIDCRGTVGALSAWHDELHPKNLGYKKVADLFAAKIREITSKTPSISRPLFTHDSAVREDSKIAGTHLQATESERLVRLNRLLLRAEKTLGSRESARQWMRSANRALGGATPLSLAETELGAREVENILGRIEHGVFS